MDNRCPKCQTVMCEKFDYRKGPNPSVELAIPTGKFSCMKCGYDPEKANEATMKEARRG